MGNTKRVYQQPSPYAVLRLHSKTVALCQVSNELSIPVEENASIRDISYGDAYSYTSLVLLANHPYGGDFMAALEDRLSSLGERIHNIECDMKWVELFWVITRDEVYSSIHIPPSVLRSIFESQCALQTTCCYAFPKGTDA